MASKTQPVSFPRWVVALGGLMLSSSAFAQSNFGAIPGEPAPSHIRDTPVSSGTLSRDGGLVLAPGAAQAGGGPALETQSGEFGIPVSSSYGLGQALEFGGSFNMLLAPQLRAASLFVSHLTLYGRYSAIPEKLAIELKIQKPGALVGAGGLRILGEAPYTTALSDVSRIYIVSNLGATLFFGSAFELNTSATYVHKVTDLFYAQALTGTGFGVAGGGVFVPGRDVPITLGTGGGMMMGENTGAGLALTFGLGGTGGLAGQSALNSVGIAATYNKGL